MTLTEAMDLDVTILRALHDEGEAIAQLVEGSHSRFNEHTEEYEDIPGLDRECLRELAAVIRSRSRISYG